MPFASGPLPARPLTLEGNAPIRRRIAVTAGVLSMLLPIMACGGSPDTGGEGGRLTVDLLTLEGTQRFPVEVMQNKGIAEKHGLELNLENAASPEAAYTRFRDESFQVGSGGIPTVARFVAKGEKLTTVYSIKGFAEAVLTPKNSPIRSFADLRGKRIAVFAGPSGTSTLMFRLECMKFFGFDPMKESKVKFLSPAIIASQLESGGLDAALIFNPFLVKLMSTGKFRSLGDLGTIWEQKTGQRPLELAVVMNSSWAQENSEAARRFVAAFDESLTYMKNILKCGKSSALRWASPHRTPLSRCAAWRAELTSTTGAPSTSRSRRSSTKRSAVSSESPRNCPRRSLRRPSPEITRQPRPPPLGQVADGRPEAGCENRDARKWDGDRRTSCRIAPAHEGGATQSHAATAGGPAQGPDVVAARDEGRLHRRVRGGLAGHVDADPAEVRARPGDNLRQAHRVRRVRSPARQPRHHDDPVARRFRCCSARRGGGRFRHGPLPEGRRCS
ncbi:MAG: hypothetical protein GEV03_20955 [Streptosporangiales bacterium]|nr:hypothetical protein [Streptosporangiales bacterium]